MEATIATNYKLTKKLKNEISNYGFNDLSIGYPGHFGTDLDCSVKSFNAFEENLEGLDYLGIDFNKLEKSFI